jgi:hypothetical protein
MNMLILYRLPGHVKHEIYQFLSIIDRFVQHSAGPLEKNQSGDSRRTPNGSAGEDRRFGFSFF